VPRRPGPFESGQRAARRGKAPRTLGRSPGRAGGARGRRSGAPWMLGEEGSRVFYLPCGRTRPRAHAPSLGVRTAWLARPSHRAPRRDAARLTNAGEKRREKGEERGGTRWLPCGPYPAVRAAGLKPRVVLVGCIRRWAGGLGGFAAGSCVGRPS
jgi:hypothetical protein